MFCFTWVAQHESFWWRQFLVSSEVILWYCMLGTLFQEAFLHFLHNGIFLLALDAGSRKNRLVSPTSPSLAFIKEYIEWIIILGHSEMCNVEKEKGTWVRTEDCFPRRFAMSRMIHGSEVQCLSPWVEHLVYELILCNSPGWSLSSFFLVVFVYLE